MQIIEDINSKGYKIKSNILQIRVQNNSIFIDNLHKKDLPRCTYTYNTCMYIFLNVSYLR